MSVDMVTVLRVEGMRIVIYANDHAPAHVHVIGDGEAKIGLAGPDGDPVLIWADGMGRVELRQAMRVVSEQAAFLRQRWEEIHG